MHALLDTERQPSVVLSSSAVRPTSRGMFVLVLVSLAALPWLSIRRFAVERGVTVPFSIYAFCFAVTASLLLLFFRLYLRRTNQLNQTR